MQLFDGGIIQNRGTDLWKMDQAHVFFVMIFSKSVGERSYPMIADFDLAYLTENTGTKNACIDSSPKGSRRYF